MSYPAYPNYKDSGVEWLGEVPAHWEVKRLRYVAELNPSKTEVRTLPAERSVSFIPMEAVGEDGSLSLVQTRQVGEVLAGYTYVREGDVTIAKITPCFENGKGAVMHGLKNHVGFGSTELIVLRPQASLTTSEYLYRVVSSEPFRVLGESSMYGAGGQKRVPDDFVRNFKIAWPPYKEQVEIQAFLDHEIARIDALVEEQKRLIELLKEKRQAVISHAVTKGLDPDVPMKDSGIEWVGEVPAHWDISTLKYHITTRKGVAFNASEFSQVGVPVVKASDIKSLTIKNTSSYMSKGFLLKHPKAVLKTGDIVLSTVGSNPLVKNSAVGQIASIPAKYNGALLNQNTVVFDVDDKKILPRYLLFVLQSRGYRDHLDLNAHGTANQASLNVMDMINFYLALPPINEQRHIIKCIDSEMDKIKGLLVAADKSKILLVERRSALVSVAVTGKIDVRGWQAAREADPSEMLMAAEERATYG